MPNNTTEIIISSSTSEAEDIIAGHLVELLQTYDILVVLLATIGMFAIAKAIFQVCGSVVFDMFKLFIITPVILISALLDARKDPAKRSELKEIKDYIKANPNVLKSTIIWFVFLLIILAIMYQIMLASEVNMLISDISTMRGE